MVEAPKKVDLDFRALLESDLPHLTALYRTVFNIEREESFWRWKYFQNPAGEHMLMAAIKPDSGQVIGTVGTIPIDMALDGRKVLGAQACDIVILPEYQKGGPFFKLHKMNKQESLDRGVNLLFGFSVEKTLKISVRLLKFKDIFPIRRLVKVLDPTHYIQQMVRVAWVAKLSGKFSRHLLKTFTSTRIQLPQGYSLKEVSSFDVRYDALMKVLAGKTKIMVYKDSAYLNWRYVDCPIFDYRIFAVESDDNIAGYAVVSIQDEEIRRAYILEMIAAPDRQDVMKPLLNQVIRHCFDAKADTINAWAMEHSPAWNLERSKGFKVKETAHNLIARPHFDDDSLMDVTDSKLWDISLGDSDYH